MVQKNIILIKHNTKNENRKEGFELEDKVIITIGRQFGSLGTEIGKKLAERLNTPFYDKEIIEAASKESGITQDLFENVNEKQNKSFLYSLLMGSYTFGSRVSTLSDMTINDKLFLIQSNVIKKFAKAGSCVIIGRCADYILRGQENCVNVFIHAQMKDKISRISERYSISEENAEDMIIKTDKKRANYYNYYSSQKWGKAEHYHLCIDSSSLSVENAAILIETFAKMKCSEK